MKEKDYSVFSKDYDELFKTQIEEFSKNILKGKEKYHKKKYDLFYPSCGNDKKMEIKFLIYGQATNSWKPEFNINDDAVKLTEEARRYSNTIDKEQENPLDWVNKNWKEWKMSNFFWNVSYLLINTNNARRDKIDNQEMEDYSKPGSWLNKSDWCKSMIWSNLAKITPTKMSNENSNPDNFEWECQREFSIKLFQQEIEVVQPKYIIMLTGYETWATHYLKNIKMNFPQNMKYVQAYGNYDKGASQIVVVKRARFEKNIEKWFTTVNEILSVIKQNV
ncbi:MAG: hypothetical protein ABI723_19775 [Bacteroidia bacterium]